MEDLFHYVWQKNSTIFHDVPQAIFTSKGFEYFCKVFEKIDLINMPDLKRKKESPCTPVMKSKASPGTYTATNYERETISSASKKVVPKGGSSEKRPKKRVARQRKKIPLVELETNNSTLSTSLEGPLINQYLDDEGQKISMFECMENTSSDDIVKIIIPKYDERSIPDSYNQEQKDVALLILDAFETNGVAI
ncbi:hypothetical protein C9374_012655 [Naegleria lovaniensis]|uniref:Uncharacterized protein n=1 Tax=Naegleria lovaniensis TaxID=51637 RepID=A0AA88GWP0_NAELO|nr:uncharacterized protein C9374_012655 [Naegleria lovaniensis]KAG2392403.1 hypothetical protein C9374_012655 [Naegleria lovaniensis]